MLLLPTDIDELRIAWEHYLAYCASENCQPTDADMWMVFRRLVNELETEGNQVVVKLPESIVKRIVNVCKDSDQSGEVTARCD